MWILKKRCSYIPHLNVNTGSIETLWFNDTIEGLPAEAASVSAMRVNDDDRG